MVIGNFRILGLPLLLSAIFVSALPSFWEGCFAQDVELTAELKLRSRFFIDEPLDNNQLERRQFTGGFEPNLFWRNSDRNHQVAITASFHADSEDEEATRFDILEAYWSFSKNDWDLLVGINRVFWGVTESRHLVNIVNQVDGVESLDEEYFLGQPMVKVGHQTALGRFDLFLMTGFRERTFPGQNGRLRNRHIIDSENARHESAADNWRGDIALRYSHSISGIDIGFHLFSGTGREPLSFDSITEGLLLPVYGEINQAGVDFQLTHDAWLRKFEGLAREGQGDSFGAFVLGAEYTFFEVLESSVDLGVMVEGLYDGRSIGSTPTIFQKDLFAGIRIVLNDTQNSYLVARVLYDFENGPESMRIEATRRLTDKLLLELEAHFFLEHDKQRISSAFRQDNVFTVSITRYF